MKKKKKEENNWQIWQFIHEHNTIIVYLFICLSEFFSHFSFLFFFPYFNSILARNTVHRSAYNKLLIDSYMRIISSDAPTYIGSSPSPLIMSNHHRRSKSPPPRLPSFTLGKLDYLYNGAAAHHNNLQYVKKLRNRCDQMST